MAAEIVGDLAVRIVPDGSGFPAALNAMLGGVQKQVQQNVNLNTTAAQQSVQQLGNSINTHVNGAMANAIMQAGAFTASFYAAKGMINKVRNELAGLYDPLVKATAGFKAILGEQKGSKLLEDIRQFAKESPFVTGELVSYSQQLLGVGQSAESIIPLLQNTGDLIASLGGSQSNISRVLFTLTQIRSIGRLAGQDAMQLQSAQIPITKLLAETMNVPLAQVKKLQEQGKISADKVFEALNKAGEKVRGSMDAVTNTIEGARSVLQDTMTIMFQNQTSLRAIYDDVVKSIKTVATALGSDEVTGAVTEFFTEVYKIYESLKVFMAEFAATSGKLAMAGLQSLTDILGVLATVLNSIPEQALKMLAQALAALAMIRAPLFLMEYVKQLKTISGLVTQGTLTRAVNNLAGGISGTGTAADKAAGKVGLLSQAIEKMKNAQVKSSDSYWKSMPIETVPMRIQKRWADAQYAQEQEMRIRQAMASGADIYDAPLGPFPVPSKRQAFMQRNMGKFVVGGALAANVAAQYIPQDNLAGATASGALSMGSMGLMAALGLGATGPVGAGVAVGAALLGGITSYINKSKEMEQAMIAKWQKLGADSAKAWIESQSAVLMGEGQEALDTYATKIADLEKQLEEGPRSSGAAEAAQRRIDEIEAKIKTGGTMTTTESIELEQARRTVDEIGGSAKEQKVQIQKQIDDLAEIKNKLIGDYSIAVQEILKQDPELEKFFAEFNDPGMFDAVAKAAGKFKLSDEFDIDPDKVGSLQRALMALGLGLDDLKTKGAAVLAPIINAFINLPESVQAATAAVTGFNNAIEKAAADKTQEPFEKQAAAMQGMVASAKSLRAAMVEIKPENLASVMGQISSASQQEFNLAYANAMKMLAGQAISEPEKEARAKAEATKYQNLLLAQSFMELRKQIGGSDKDFENLLKQMGYYEQYTIAMQSATGMNAEALKNYRTQIDRLYTSYGQIPKIEPGARVSLLKMAKIYDVTIKDLATILQLQGQIDPHMVITVTADTEDAALKLARLGAIAGGPDKVAEFVKNYKMPAAEGMGLFGIPEAATLVEYYKSRFVPPKTGGGGGGGISPMQQVTENFKGLFKQVADTIKQSAETWKTSVRESAQYQQAVSVSTATKNARQQTEDLKAMNEGIARLKARGLTEEAITSLGITGVKDLKQVRKLLGASDAELVALSTAIKERDKAATDLADARKAEENKKMMTDAIVAAAKILKVRVTDEQVQQIINNNIDVTVDASDQALADLAKKIADLIKGGGITR